MKNYKIQVITKVPDIESNDGNLYDDTFIGLWDKSNDELYFRAYQDMPKYRHHTTINVKLSVFILGEIIIVDDKLREIGGMGRKADKWFVDYKLFEMKDIRRAIDLSVKINNKENDKKYI